MFTTAMGRREIRVFHGRFVCLSFKSMKKRIEVQRKARLSEHEYKLLIAYRRRTDIQGVINNVLGISSKDDGKPAKIICVCEKGK